MTTKSSQTSELIAAWRAMGPIAWAESPYGWIDIGGQPIALAAWQRACLAAWWALCQTITTLGISLPKKVGKTALNGILLAWRWLALPGEHFAVGNDLDQSASRQFGMIADMINRHPYLSRNTTVTGRTITFVPTGSTIKALATDAAGNAGANHLTASHTEAWAVIYEAGIRSWEELTPPPGRSYGLPALRIADSYAGFEGESDTWHGLVDRGLAGERISTEWPIYRAGGLLLFHAVGSEAQRTCFRGTPDDAAAYYADQRAALRPSAFLRLHENTRATGSESFISLDWWDRCVDPARGPIVTRGNERLFVGVDAALKHDSAAVVACFFDQALRKVVIASCRIWYPNGETLDLDATIGDRLRELWTRQRVDEIRYDPYQMAGIAQQLQREGITLTPFDQTVGNLTRAGQNLYDLLKGGNLVAYADDELRRQVAHAVAIETSRGWRIAKERASAKVDAVVALAFAALAAIEGGAVATPRAASGKAAVYTVGDLFS